MKKAKKVSPAPPAARFPGQRIERFSVGKYLRAEADSDGYVSLWVFSEVSKAWSPAYLYPGTARALAGQLLDLAGRADAFNPEAAK